MQVSRRRLVMSCVAISVASSASCVCMPYAAAEGLQPSTIQRIATQFANGIPFGIGQAPIYAVRDTITGELKGPAIGLLQGFRQWVRMFERWGKIEIRAVVLDKPGDVITAMRDGAIVAGFQGKNQSREADMDFTPEYEKVDLIVMVRSGSSIKSLADLDQHEISVAVPKGDLADILLQLKAAQKVRTETVQDVFTVLEANKVQAVAVPRPNVMAYMHKHPGDFRALQEPFGTNHVSIAVAKGQTALLELFSSFVDWAVNTELVLKTIQDADLTGIEVVLPDTPVAGSISPR